MRIVTVLLLVVSGICFAAMNYVEYAHLRLISGGLSSPDTRLTGYSFAELEAWRDSIGRNGVELYLKAIPNGFDKVFPILLGLTFVSLLHLALSQFQNYRSRSKAVKVMLPLFFIVPYVFLDYWENTVIVDYLSNDIFRNQAIAQLASGITVSKFAWIGILLVLLFGLWFAGLSKRKAPNHE